MAHSKVSWNDRVNQEAKKVAAGTTLRDRNLPPVLRHNLPTSKSSLLQNLQKTAKMRYKAYWEASPQYTKLKKYNTKFPCKGFLKLTKSLSQCHTTILIQIHTGHFPLNNYLFKHKLADSDICNQCQTLCQENIIHFLFECPAYQEEQSTMNKIYSLSKNNLPKILTNPKHTLASLSYISKTERLTPPPWA